MAERLPRAVRSVRAFANPIGHTVLAALCPVQTLHSHRIGDALSVPICPSAPGGWNSLIGAATP
jgi:hypothetical protein